MLFPYVTIFSLIISVRAQNQQAQTQQAQNLQAQSTFYLNDRIYFEGEAIPQAFKGLNVKDTPLLQYGLIGLPVNKQASSVGVGNNNAVLKTTAYGGEQQTPVYPQVAQQTASTQNAQFPSRQISQGLGGQVSQVPNIQLAQASNGQILDLGQAPIGQQAQSSSIQQAVPSVPQSMQAADNKFLYSLTDFGLNLMKTINQVDNVVVSPYSISSVLALLQQAAEGQTQEQITSALQLTPNESMSSFKHISEDFKHRNSHSILKTACNVFVANGFTLNPGFKEIANNNFGSDVTIINFNKPDRAATQINKWVASETNNKILTLVSPDSVDATTQVVLVNAIYFKGLWDVPFRVESTRTQEFQLSNGAKKMVPFMSSRRTVKAGTDPANNAKIIILPFENDQYSLMLIIPSPVIGMAGTLAQMSSERLISYHTLPPTETALYIPKFTIRADTDLNQVLSKMGISKLFSSSSELPKLGNYQSFTPKISSAVHSAVLSIDEKGGNAAAATSFAAVALSNDEPSFVFRADTPFIAVLWDIKTHLPLFMAKIDDPTSQ